MTTGAPHECACCGGIADRTPVDITNRPGLPAVAYRTGTYREFRAALLAGLSRHGRDALRGLTTRETDDWSIALLDAWAVAADVVTFYTERIANEHYLGTATEHRSVAGQAALLGYRLRPGVAASAWLALTAEATPGGPDGSPVPVGTRVQTIPGPGEVPQSFETVAPVVAYPRWNRPEVAVLAPGVPGGAGPLVLDGVSTGLRPGDQLLVVGTPWVGNADWLVVRVLSVDLDPAAGTTRVVTAPAPVVTTADARTLEVHVLRHRSTLFGASAIDPRLLAPAVLEALSASRGSDHPSAVVNGEWDFPTVSTGTPLALSASYPDVHPAGFAVLSKPGVGAALCEVSDVQDVSRAAFALSAQVTSLTLGPTVSFRDADGTEGADPLGGFGGGATRTTVVHLGSERLALAPVAVTAPLLGDRIPLAVPLPGLPEPHDVLVRGTRPRVREAQVPGFPVGEEPVLLSLVPVGTDPDRVRCVLRVASGEDVEVTLDAADLHLLPPRPEDPVIGEVVTVAPAPAGVDLDELALVEPLRSVYSREAPIELFGNVAAATHGESAPREVLGSGDGAWAFQRFTLRRTPLTHVPSDEPGGARSSLEVRVDGIRWEEVRSLFGHGPRDRVYTTRTDDDGRVTVTFGDGRTGARLPTGLDNVVARYRTGTGRAGDARAGQIALPVARPLGLRNAVNPLRSAGGQDPQTAADARANAPRSVLTLGRVVALQDYADHAADHAGVAKATATWTWDGRRRGVHVTIAPADGRGGPDLVGAVRRALLAVSDPRVALEVRDARPSGFVVAIRLRVLAEYEPEPVRACVVDRLVHRYAFDRRTFGQGVSRSELAEVVHGVEGVGGAHVERLHLVSDVNGGMQPFLPAPVPVPGGGPDAAAAVILTLAPEHTLVEVGP